MKKISFYDKFCQTAAVLAGTMTQTRRIMTGVLPEIQELRVVNDVCEYKNPYTNKWYRCNSKHQPQYKVGEVVAVAQKYRDIPDYNADLYDDDLPSYSCSGGSQLQYTQGWDNKMFVKAELMPHRIRIEKIRVERLQDISDADCLAEGIEGDCAGYEYSCGKNRYVAFKTPKIAYSSLIDKISGKGTWERNPWTLVYNFKLVK